MERRERWKTGLKRLLVDGFGSWLFYHGRFGSSFAPEARDVRGERVLAYRPAELAHERQVVMKVVQRVQTRAQDLVGALQVVQVRAAEVAAGVTTAVRIERPGIAAVPGIANLDIAMACVQPAVARVARWQHAVE